MCVKHVPALYHNCANKFGDFLAAGLPVVVTYPGWQGKLLENYDAGLVASTEEGPENLAKALLALQANSSERLAMAANARRLGRQEFARDDLVRRFEEVLLDAIEA
jgi:UDP-N-acetylglucosamine:LPS N-acetylglucosamine transferase